MIHEELGPALRLSLIHICMTIEEALPYLKEHQQEITDRIYRGKYTDVYKRQVYDRELFLSCLCKNLLCFIEGDALRSCNEILRSHRL